LTIAWDIDDVLNDFMKQWFHNWQHLHNTCNLSYADITQNPPHNIIGVSLDEYRDSIDQFRSSELFANMPPNQDILQWFKQYGHFFRHIAVSAVSRKVANVSSSWLFRHFGDWIRTFAFIPSPRIGENIPLYDSTKAQYLNWLEKADIFIEDNQNNVDAIGQTKIKSFIVAQPWNNSKIQIGQILTAITGEL